MFDVVGYVRHVERPGEGMDYVDRSGIDTSQYNEDAIGHGQTGKHRIPKR